MKYIVIIFSVIFIYGCSSDPDGGLTLGVDGSPAFYMTASDNQIEEYEKSQVQNYVNMPVYRICSKWDQLYQSDRRSRMSREYMSRALIIKGENPMLCRNPSSDSSNRSRDEINSLKKDAANAKAEAIRAKRNAEREVREAEKRAYCSVIIAECEASREPGSIRGCYCY